MFYHIWNRGVDRCDIFRVPDNFRYFLSKYGQYVNPVAETYAYCLLPNHFHFLIRTLSHDEQKERWTGQQTEAPFHFQEPSQAIANLMNGYVRAFNRMHGPYGRAL